MEKSVASQVVDGILALEREWKVLDALSDKIPDDEERHFRKRLAGIMVAYNHLLLSVIEAHPELNPDASSNAPDASRS